jgi:hypothetical protein
MVAGRERETGFCLEPKCPFENVGRRKKYWHGTTECRLRREVGSTVPTSAHSDPERDQRSG